MNPNKDGLLMFTNDGLFGVTYGLLMFIDSTTVMVYQILLMGLLMFIGCTKKGGKMRKGSEGLAMVSGTPRLSSGCITFPAQMLNG